MKQNIIEGLKEYDGHRFVVYVSDPNTKLKGFIAIHRGGNTPAFGATRFWYYADEKSALEDVLRLSRLMSYKAALAGLPYGGAKGVILAPENPTQKEKEGLLRAFAQKVNILGGKFITGSDVGVTDDDVKKMALESDFIVGVSCDPVKYTVEGVYAGILESVKKIFGTDSIRDRTIAIQGLGKTGWGLLELVAKDAKKIYVFDIDEEKMRRAREKFAKVIPVPEKELFELKVDIFSPCALGHTLSSKNIEKLNCKIVAGSANNQLVDEEAGEMMHEKGILYAPDYVINAGGLMAVVDEYEFHGTDDTRVRKKVDGIKNVLHDIFAKSDKENISTSRASNTLAEHILNAIS